MTEKPLLLVVGPTASGKSTFAIKLALALNGEIVSADSRYLYRELEIGVAKPTLLEISSVPHHLVNVASLEEPWNLGLYKQSATAFIEEIHLRGKLPILAGGTGQYVRSILQNWKIPPHGPDDQLRGDLETIGNQIGFDKLYEILTAIDPQAAANIDYRNHRRTIRALEVILSTGRKFSNLREREKPAYDTMIIGLDLPRDILYERIDQRVDNMISQGLVGEVQQLLDAGFGPTLETMRVIGYNEIMDYLAGEIELVDAIGLIKQNTHAYVRRQANWFKPSDPEIHWLNAQDPELLEKALDLVEVKFGIKPGK